MVTRNGIPIARIVAAGGDGGRQLTDTQERVLKRTMRRLRKGWSLGGGRFERDSLYER